MIQRIFETQKRELGVLDSEISGTIASIPSFHNSILYYEKGTALEIGLLTFI